ncbi:oligomeric, coiled-coil, peripheral membrane protein [Arthrobotrys conoides]|uniref:Autophagy-related protein 11 n=1 Tax=Arthrobotrys conoides TaxID=74498 RepID=A0AAN8RL04_9PEZI
MQLTILYAHTGDAYSVDPNLFTTVDELKAWVAEQFKVPVPNQILTTIKGGLVKQANLVTEKELFLYSRQYITPSSSTPPPTFPIPTLSKPSPPPDRLESQSDISSWRTLFANRLSWSNSILSHANTLAASIESTTSSIAVIDRSLSAATTNLDSHVKTSGQKYDELKTWAFEVLESQEKLLRSWEGGVEKLGRIPIHKEVGKIVAAENVKSGRSSGGPGGGGVVGKTTGTLVDIVSLSDVRNAAKELEVIAREFGMKVQGLGNTLESIKQQSSSLTADIHRGWKKNEDTNSAEAEGLLADIRVLVQKIQQDTEHIATYANNSKSISSISKIAHTHTKDYLPALIQYTSELGGIVQACIQRKNVAAGFTVQSLQAISRIEQRLYTDLTSVVKKCEGEYEERSERGYGVLVLVARLPGVYSSFLVECVRRREWGEKMGQDGAKLAEELAGLKEEEEKRRRKWWRSATSGGEVVVAFLPQQEETGGGGINVEVNFSAETAGWPVVGRADLDVLLNALKGVEGVEGLVRELAQGIIDLDKPTRRQRKATTPALATRAFKMGSIHEAAMASSSFLSTGAGGDDGTIKRLREDRARLEERARMYESRVRKLEDLLHRQRPGNAAGVQFGSSNLGNGSAATGGAMGVGSPLAAEPMSRNSSQGTIITPMNGVGVGVTNPNRRISITEDPSRALTMRIVTLENDLEKEKEARQKLEAEALKKFEDEKRGWNERMMEVDSTKKDLLANIQAQQQEFNTERKEMQDKIMEVEEQLEGWKTRVEEVYAEMDRMEESKALEAARNSGLGKEVEEMQREIEEYKMMLEEHEGKMGSMIRENEKMRMDAEKAAEEAKRELKIVKLENEEKKVVIEGLEKKVLGEGEKHSLAVVDLERKIHALEAAAKVKDAENKRLTTKVEKATKELDIFRSKVTGVLVQPIHESHHELTRTQILDVDELTARLENFVGELRQEIAQGETQIKVLKDGNRLLQTRFEARTVKTKDLTQKLYTHNARSGQLLESLGFKVIVDDDGATQIVRISRGNADGDQMAKSISMSTSLPPLPRDFAKGDVELLYWMDNEDSEAESEKYATFLSSIGTFDLDAFGDAVTKRVREAEHMARKWQKQCRDYRDKYHRAATEASEKIAYKSFKEGDLALFLPTRNQVTRPWAAFNVGAPHYFLREVEGHRLKARDWLLARISRVEQRVVDLKSGGGGGAGSTVATLGDKGSSVSSDTGVETVDEDNPFQLSDGLRWYLLDAVEEGKLGAPSTPGLGSSTVAAANVDAKGSTSIRLTTAKKTLVGKDSSTALGVRKTLTKSLAQSGGPVVGGGGETSSIRSRESRESGRKGSEGSSNVRPVISGGGSGSGGVIGGSAVEDEGRPGTGS